MTTLFWGMQDRST